MSFELGDSFKCEKQFEPHHEKTGMRIQRRRSAVQYIETQQAILYLTWPVTIKTTFPMSILSNFKVSHNKNTPKSQQSHGTKDAFGQKPRFTQDIKMRGPTIKLFC